MKNKEMGCLTERKADKYVKVGNSVEFTAVSEYGCYRPESIRVRWLLGGRLVSTENKWYHTFEEPGEYWITVKIYEDQYKLLDSKTRRIIATESGFIGFSGLGLVPVQNEPTTATLNTCWFCGHQGTIDIDKICDHNHPRLNAKAYEGALVGVDENTELRMSLGNRHELGIYLAVHWKDKDNKSYWMEFPLSIMGQGLLWAMFRTEDRGC